MKIDDKPIKKHFQSWEGLKLFEQVKVPVWIFDVVEHKLWWGNNASIKFWKAKSVEDLTMRNFSDDSLTVRQRLKQIIDNTNPNSYASEIWTLYPHGNPITVQLVLTPIIIKDDNDAVLIQVSTYIDMKSDPQILRLMEITRYTSIMVASFTLSGQCLARNPADQQEYNDQITADINENIKSDLEIRFVMPFDYDDISKKLLLGNDVSGDYQMTSNHGIIWCHLSIRHGRDPLTGGDILVMTQENITDRIEMFNQLTTINAELDNIVEKRTSELRHALDAAHQASYAKSSFLANMSHDLRTPLNAIIGFSDFILHEMHGELRPKSYQTYIKDIYSSGKYLLNMVSDILDLSKIAAGELSLQEEKFNIQELIISVFDLQQQSIDKKNLDVHMDLSNKPINIYADELRLRQIIDNILSNAVKFSKDNGLISIKLYIDDNGNLILQLEDCGIGISKDDMKAIFKPFAQGKSSSLTAKTTGTGLGLSIIKSLVTLHDGSVELESVIDVGTVVTLMLPAARLTDLDKI